MAGVYYTVMDRRSALSMLLAVPALTLANRVEASPKPMASLDDLNHAFHAFVEDEAKAGRWDYHSTYDSRLGDEGYSCNVDDDGRWFLVLYMFWVPKDGSQGRCYSVNAYVYFNDNGQPHNHIQIDQPLEDAVPVAERLRRLVVGLGPFDVDVPVPVRLG